MVSVLLPPDSNSQENTTNILSNKEVFIVINPTAAGGRTKNIWEEQIQPLLHQYTINYDFEFTSAPLHAIEIAKKRINEGYRIICSVGGDGTANEVINGILKADKSGIFAAIPIGTGNDTPTAFGIPEDDIEAAVECLANGQDKSFDVGYCQTADRYFGGVASMGFDAEVANRTYKGFVFTKKFLGTRSYQLALVTTLLKFRPYSLKIQLDGQEIIEGRRMLVAIGNGKRYGGGMHVCPNAEVNDGKFTATEVQKIGRITLVRFFPTVYDGNHLTHKSAETFEGQSISIDSPNKKCIYQADGEILGYLPETFITKPNYLTVRVPTPWLSYTDIWNERLNEKKGYTDPFTGNKLLLAKLAYLNPISNYKRGLEWNKIQEEEIAEEQLKKEVKSNEEPQTYLHVKEKHFSRRVWFFLMRTFIQTVSVSIAFTAPIVFPWFFDIVIPNFLTLIPPEIGTFFKELIKAIQSLFTPFKGLEPIIRFFMDLSAIFNPFLIFSVLMIFFKEVGAIAEEEYQDPFKSTNGTPTSSGYFMESVRRKFNTSLSSATTILFLVSTSISLFLVLRRARGIIYEVMTTKEEIKHLESVRKVFLKYCKEGTYTDIHYTKNRLTESKKAKTFATLVKYGPIVSAIIPVLIAIFFILL